MIFMRSADSTIREGDMITITGRLRNPKWRWWKPWQPRYISARPMRVISVSSNSFTIGDDDDHTQ